MNLAEVETRFKNGIDPALRGRTIHEFGTIRRLLRGRCDFAKARILDFGCGAGIAAASIALRFPNAAVFGVDVVEQKPDALVQSFRNEFDLDIPGNLRLEQSPPGVLPEHLSDLDLIFAWSVFEHVNFVDLEGTFALLRARLAKQGTLLVQINPLYFSPRGGHLYRTSKEPWFHLLMQIDAIDARVHSVAGKSRDWEQFVTLNRATADDIVDAAVSAGFSIVSQERVETKEVPPERLLRIYNERALRTEEIRLVLAP